MKALRIRTLMVRTITLLAVAIAIFALASPDPAAAQQDDREMKLTVSVTDSFISLGWPPANGSDGYVIAYRRNDDSRSWHERYFEHSYEGSHVTYGTSFYHLINGIEYAFKVTPYLNGNALGAMTAFATPNGPVLQPPTLTATPGAEPGSVNLSWNATPRALSYTYQYKAKDASWHVDGEEPNQRFASLKTTVKGSVTTATIENLAPGTEYTFRIHVKTPARLRATMRRSDWGETGAWSTTIAPTIHTVTAASQSVTLYWNDVPGATGYAYQYKASSASNWSDEQSIAAPANFATVGGGRLTNNTAYDFRIRPTGPGAPPWSDPVTATPNSPNDSPNAPVQANVVPGTASALFTWQSGGNGESGSCPTDSFQVSITDASDAPIPGSPYKVDAMSNPSHVYRLYVDQGMDANASYRALITPYGCNTTGEPADLPFAMDGETEPQKFEEMEGSDQMLPPLRVENLDVRAVGFKANATWSKPVANAEGRCPLEDNVEYRWKLKNTQTGDVSEGSFESDADPVELALDRLKKGDKYRLMIKAYSPRCDQESKAKSFKWLQPESKGKRLVATTTIESR